MTACLASHPPARHARRKPLVALALLSIAGCSVAVEAEPTPTSTAITTTAGSGGSAPICPPAVSRTFDGDSWISADRLAAHPDGGFVLVGSFGGTLDLGVGQPITDSDGAFLARLDASGQPTAVSTIVPAGGIADVAFDAAGNMVMVTAGPPMDFGAGLIGDADHNLFVVKRDAHGALVWNRAFSLAQAHLEYARPHLDPAGGVTFGGMLIGTLDFGAGPLVGPPSGLGADCFAVRLDPHGDLVYSRQLVSTDYCTIADLAADAAGNAIIVGDFSESLTAGSTTLIGDPWAGLAVRLDPTGEPLWFQAHPFAVPWAVALTAEGEPILAGYYRANAQLGDAALPGEGMFVAKQDPAGDFLWRAGYTDLRAAESVALGPGTDIVVAGYGAITRLDANGTRLCTAFDDGGTNSDLRASRIAISAAGDVLEAATTHAYDATSNSLVLLAMPR